MLFIWYFFMCCSSLSDLHGVLGLVIIQLNLLSLSLWFCFGEAFCAFMVCQYISLTDVPLSPIKPTTECTCVLFLYKTTQKEELKKLIVSFSSLSHPGTAFHIKFCSLLQKQEQEVNCWRRCCRNVHNCFLFEITIPSRNLQMYSFVYFHKKM